MTQEIAQKNLEDFKKTADKHNIEFCLMDGTLLGAYREGKFIDDDVDDIDLGILDDNYKIDSLIAGLKEEGFEHIKELEVDGKIEGSAVYRNGNHIDIIRINKGKTKSYNLANGHSGLVAYTYPIINKFDKLNFLGAVYNTPENVEAFLEARYIDWKTPVKRENYDYLDDKQVPGLIQYGHTQKVSI